MRLDYIEFGTSPVDEECVQVEPGTGYFQRAVREGLVFKRMLTRMFSPLPGNAHFSLKRFEHDFGPYIQVCAIFDSEDTVEREWALNVEANEPLNWDEKAKSELSGVAFSGL